MKPPSPFLKFFFCGLFGTSVGALVGAIMHGMPTGYVGTFLVLLPLALATLTYVATVVALRRIDR